MIWLTSSIACCTATGDAGCRSRGGGGGSGGSGRRGRGIGGRVAGVNMSGDHPVGGYAVTGAQGGDLAGEVGERAVAEEDVAALDAGGGAHDTGRGEQAPENRELFVGELDE